MGTAGTVTASTTLSLVIQAAAPPPPDFSLGPSSGSPTSQTITAGQTANFSLDLTPLGAFSGTVNLSCAITAVVTPAPTCSLSSGSVQVTGAGTQTVTVKVGTTAPVIAVVVPYVNLPSGPMLLLWSVLFLGSTGLWMRNRKRLSAFVAPMVVLAFAFSVGCGGSSSSSTHTTPGTPAGTYTATVTATSGSTSHNVALQVIVQ